MEHLRVIYDRDTAETLVDRIDELFSDYGFRVQEKQTNYPSWSEQDAILIAYGDVINQNGRANHKIRFLDNFLSRYLNDAVNSVHILPFFPSSSDEGFSVIDYKQVRDDLGEWSDVEHMAGKYRLMADLVINHTSRFSEWFENYQMRKEPGKDYFIEIDPSVNLSKVIRPRSSPLYTAVETSNGLRHVWTTFSDDQIDLDFSNPDVLLEFIDIFLFYLSKGISLIRLDAIAYLWKEIGTKSIHLEKTHHVVKLFRDIVDHIDIDAILITETNVPFEENVSYFGEGDEAHMIYQFSLPPLLLHALLTENSRYLTEWASELPEPPKGCTYFNFTASHDGIGVRPLEGLVPEDEFDYLMESTKERGGFVSYKTNSDGTQSPYELNITYFDAFSEPGQEETELQMKRYLNSQIIMLSLQGVPGIYFQNLVASKNYVAGVLKKGEKRSINRKKWSYEELTKRVEDESDPAHIVLNFYKKALNIRKKHPAFNPEAEQKVLDLGSELFAFTRTAVQQEEEILVISNMTAHDVRLPDADLSMFFESEERKEVTDLLTDKPQSVSPELMLDPFETLWLSR
ncbi:sugar phosphorylase [Fodinibius roseus]|uniref:sugar phosphorylase n=1 Tax=Fodinibius roseus TaxID=1194090 RepID=UPI001B8CDA35|nr:sugar phosphorylase [Fodinibius roseus]